ncbi:hypothetical protein [Flavobacterium sp. H4147]|uniref:hypothetical protein n=1 Tax=Flavobacterium sp. H4147 TaxID=3034149 RepID=UPI0023EE07D3|nr:hypothetical protein [Flavobacterium sp. H4147]
MKKLLLTVFAVLGLSAMSVANNHLEVKKFQFRNIVFANCAQDQEAEFDLYISHGSSYWESYFAGARAWGTCMGG